jgi:hypothetical protein
VTQATQNSNKLKLYSKLQTNYLLIYSFVIYKREDTSVEIKTQHDLYMAVYRERVYEFASIALCAGGGTTEF